MNRGQFKDTVFNMCLIGTVVASLSLMQGMAGLNPFSVMRNIFVTEFSEFGETISFEFSRCCSYKSDSSEKALPCSANSSIVRQDTQRIQVCVCTKKK